MKIRKIICLLVPALIVIFSSCSKADDESSDFRVSPVNDGKSVKISRYEGKKQLVTIPSSLHGMTVTELGDSVFNGRDILKVKIPGSVTTIGNGAFRGCTNLINLTIPSKVTKIGENAFRDCDSLTKVTIPNSITSIENGVFRGCEGLKTVIIPNTVTSIGNSVFNGCKALTGITLPNTITSIGENAFSNTTLPI